jgi:hypothetical protein
VIKRFTIKIRLVLIMSASRNKKEPIKSRSVLLAMSWLRKEAFSMSVVVELLSGC